MGIEDEQKSPNYQFWGRKAQGYHVVSVGTNEGQRSYHRVLVPRSQQTGPRESAVQDLECASWSRLGQPPQRGKLGARHLAVVKNLSAPPLDYEMLPSPVASTPFSVDDILRLEHEQNDSKTPSRWELHRNPIKPQYLRINPESGGSESGDRAQAASFRCTWETVLEMDSNSGREPRK